MVIVSEYSVWLVVGRLWFECATEQEAYELLDEISERQVTEMEADKFERTLETVKAEISELLNDDIASDPFEIIDKYIKGKCFI